MPKKNRPQAPPVAVCEAWREGAERPLTGHEAESGRCSWEVNPEDWGDRAAGEQGWSRDGLAFRQAGKRGAVLRVRHLERVTPAAVGVWLHPCLQPASPPALPVLGAGARCRRRPSCLTRSDCSSSPWHKRQRKDFCSRHRVCLVVRKTVPPTLSLTHLAWVPAGAGMSQLQRSPTAPCISSPPSILILIPLQARRDCCRYCLPGDAGICSLSASPSTAAVVP